MRDNDALLLEDWQHALATAEDIAGDAGRLLMEGWGTHPAVEFKSEDINLVTAFDKRSEALIVSRLAAAFPEDTIVGEEGGLVPGRMPRHGGGDDGQTDETPPRRVWYVDPLDGTTNFAHGFPLFSVSIGLTVGGKSVLGAVVAPAVSWCFSGVLGGGALWNGRRITPSRTPSIATALVASGFPYVRHPQRNNVPEWLALLEAAQGTRRFGSAALDLCFVACGWLDAYWERALNPWDLVAGAAIVNAAGGRATEMDGTPFDGETGRVLASNGVIHDQMIALLHQVAKTSGGGWP